MCGLGGAAEEGRAGAGAPFLLLYFQNVFSLPPIPGEGPTTATKTPPPARGWAAGISCRFLYGIFSASQISPKICKFHEML